MQNKDYVCKKQQTDKLLMFMFPAFHMGEEGWLLHAFLDQNTKWIIAIQLLFSTFRV